MGCDKEKRNSIVLEKFKRCVQSVSMPTSYRPTHSVSMPLPSVPRNSHRLPKRERTVSELLALPPELHLWSLALKGITEGRTVGGREGGNEGGW